MCFNKYWNVHVLVTVNTDRINARFNYEMWYWTFRFHKMQGISWLAENQLAPEEGLCSMQLVTVITSHTLRNRPPCQANICPVAEEIPHSLRKGTIKYCVHKPNSGHYTESDDSSPYSAIFYTSICLLSSHPYLGLPRCIFLAGLQTKLQHSLSEVLHACNMPYQFHLPWLNHHDSWWIIQFTNFHWTTNCMHV